MRRFFPAARGSVRDKSRFRHSDADYFNLSEKNAGVATARRDKQVPTIEPVRRVIETMPHDWYVERRDRALLAFTLLTRARDSAIASLKRNSSPVLHWPSRL